MRIDKLLSNLKYGSRNEINRIIKENRVSLNGATIKSASIKVDPLSDIILLDGKKIEFFINRNLAIYKPKGYVSANKDNLYKTVISLLPENEQRYDYKIAGRLDVDAEGLLILTTNGMLAHKITSPKSNIGKKYDVLLKNDLSDIDVSKLTKGIELKDDKGNYIAIAKSIKVLEKNHVIIEITKGRFHQVKKMFEALDNNVVVLKRISIGNLLLNDLLPGDFRVFEDDEI